MGNKASAETAKKIAWAMPPWCIRDFQVNEKTVSLVTDSWRMCMSGAAVPFLLAKEREENLTPLVFFYNSFYYFLFELLPEVRPLFKRGIAGQGKMLANVIKYIVRNLQETQQDVFVASLTHLAKVHNKLGITADQYSVMGMCLVHTVRVCTGPEYFTDDIRMAWVHVYSKMMDVIIPVVVAGGMPGDEENIDTLMKKNKVFNYKDDSSTPEETKASRKTQNKKEDGPLRTGTQQSLVASQPNSHHAHHHPRPSKPGANEISTEGASSEEREHSSPLTPLTRKPSPAPNGTFHSHQHQHQQSTSNLNTLQVQKSASNHALSPGAVSLQALDINHSHTHKYARLEKALKLAELMEEEIECIDRMIGIIHVSRCFVGKDAIHWLIQHKHCVDTEDAIDLCSILLSARVISSVNTSSTATPATLGGKFANDLSFYTFSAPRGYQKGKKETSKEELWEEKEGDKTKTNGVNSSPVSEIIAPPRDSPKCYYALAAPATDDKNKEHQKQMVQHAQHKNEHRHSNHNNQSHHPHPSSHHVAHHSTEIQSTIEIKKGSPSSRKVIDLESTKEGVEPLALSKDKHHGSAPGCISP